MTGKIAIWLMIAAALGSAALAAPLPAELVMGENSTWRGTILSRDGDWIEFNRDSSARPMRVGTGTIREINFRVQLNGQALVSAMESLKYDQAIEMLYAALEPFSEYSDIPSNLGRYYIVLAELYYRTGENEKAIALTSEIVKDDRSPDLQNKARVYWMLSLIAAGKAEEATKLMGTFNWDGEPAADAPPEELYVRAKLLALNGDNSKAVETAARIVAFHSQDSDWMQPAELLCAELYTELGMYDSADEVCRQIILLYENSPEYEKALALRGRIEELRSALDVDEQEM